MAKNNNPATKRKRRSWACLGLAIFSAAVLAYRYIPQWCAILSAKASQSASIGVIGGADGPTAIFVTGGYFPSGTFIVLLVMGIIGFIALRKIKDE